MADNRQTRSGPDLVHIRQAGASREPALPELSRIRAGPAGYLGSRHTQTTRIVRQNAECFMLIVINNACVNGAYNSQGSHRQQLTAVKPGGSEIDNQVLAGGEGGE